MMWVQHTLGPAVKKQGWRIPVEEAAAFGPCFCGVDIIFAFSHLIIRVHVLQPTRRKLQGIKQKKKKKHPQKLVKLLLITLVYIRCLQSVCINICFLTSVKTVSFQDPHLYPWSLWQTAEIGTNYSAVI